jgi:biopolymer transport protein ExbB
MKKIFMFLAVIGLLTISAEYQKTFAQDQAAEQTEAVAQASDEVVDPFAAGPNDTPIHQQLKKLFIEGGATFMALVLLCLILGLAIAISKIITLSIAQNNNQKLLDKIEDCLKNEGVDKAFELCKNTPGPVARIFTQGLLRVKDGQGIEKAEKSVIEYGSVEMGKLEKGLSWIGLFIGIAPQLGFMGTVLGLIQAFDAIEVAGDISPALVAGGMKVALITTVGGLVVAIILQLFYNYIISKIDTIVVDMEDSSISLVDMLVKYSK